MTMDWAAWMRLACREAGRGTGETGPNPLVGALAVKGGKCVGRGYHKRVGEAHAEVFALAEAGRRARGADLVVTLEPCTHTGRTGPCVERILDAGVRRVFVGTLDPNPRECGAGVRRLREGGVEVVVGVEEGRCRKQNEAYFKFITTGIPFVTVKLGCSLDGRLGPVSGRGERVTGKEFQRFVHGLRRDSCAVMVGGRTVVADDPQLTVRFARPATHPWRVVVLGSEAPRAESRVFQGLETERTIVFSGVLGSEDEALQRLREQVVQRGWRWHEISRSEGGKPDLGQVLSCLGELGVSRLMVEGGGRLAGAMAQAGYVDRWVVAWAPVFVGPEGTPMVAMRTARNMGEATKVRLERWLRLGQDLVGVYRSDSDYTRVIPSGEGES